MLGRAWDFATWLAARRRVKARDDDYAAQIYGTQTGRMGVRMTELLRDRVRRTWLRVRDESDER